MTLLSTAFAQIRNPIVANNTDDGVTFLSRFIPQMVSLIIVVGGIYFFFMLLLGSVKWLSSGGDKGQVQTARDQITHALIGITLLFSAWAIARLVSTVFGIDLINVDLTPILP